MSNTIHAFFDDAKAAFQETREPSVIKTYGIALSQHELQILLSPAALRTYSQTHANRLDWLNKTFQEKLDQYFTNPSIRSLLASLMGYVGASRKTPALFVLLGTLTYFINGSHYMHGGPQALADLMGRYITEHGGTILCNSRVDNIMVDNGQITGVRTGDKIFKTSVVIANINAKTLYTKLLEPADVPTDLLTTIKALKMGDSSVMVNLGVGLESFSLWDIC